MNFTVAFVPTANRNHPCLRVDDCRLMIVDLRGERRPMTLPVSAARKHAAISSGFMMTPRHHRESDTNKSILHPGTSAINNHHSAIINLSPLAAFWRQVIP